MIKFLDLHAQYESLRPEMDAAMAAVIRDSAYINGPQVGSFERAFGAYIGSPHCIGVANGTDAIEIILEALALPPGSEVIVPANSFVGSSEPVTRAGLKVVFADVDPSTYVLDVADVRRRITKKTKGIVAVHLYGHPAPMTELMQLAREHDLKVIEDCAQAHGASIDGVSVGTLGHAGTWSFYPGKNLGAYGDAGAISTGDAELAKKSRMIANHGRVEKYNHLFEGRNSRLDSLQAAVLEVKLKHLDRWVATRNRQAAEYSRRLAGVGDLALPVIAKGARHAFHLYVVRTARRDALMKFLADAGVQTGIHYPIALPKLKAYESLGQQHEPMFSNRADTQVLSLPLGDHLGDGDLDHIAATIKAFFAKAA
jgi:dTDP-4-amino-4,6-dideoxygalactose transaminase